MLHGGRPRTQDGYMRFHREFEAFAGTGIEPSRRHALGLSVRNDIGDEEESPLVAHLTFCATSSAFRASRRASLIGNSVGGSGLACIRHKLCGAYRPPRADRPRQDFFTSPSSSPRSVRGSPTVARGNKRIRRAETLPSARARCYYDQSVMSEACSQKRVRNWQTTSHADRRADEPRVRRVLRDQLHKITAERL